MVPGDGVGGDHPDGAGGTGGPCEAREEPPEGGGGLESGSTPGRRRRRGGPRGRRRLILGSVCPEGRKRWR